MSGVYSVLLLVLSNIFMTFAWYGHLKLSETGISKNWPLIAIIAFSWGIAFFEYVCQVPANRIGFIDNGGPFSLIQLKVIQEVVSLLVFTVIVTMVFKGETFHWNHIAAFACFAPPRTWRQSGGNFEESPGRISQTHEYSPWR